MKWLSRKRKEDGVGYWQTIADALAALLLIILLVLLLVVLRMMRMDEEKKPPAATHSGAYHERSYNSVYVNIERERDGYYKEDHHGGGANGGRGGYGGGRYDERPEEIPTGDGHGYGDGEKAAVLVRVLDGDTDRIIREAGVAFELYERGSIKELNTYYPEKLAFKSFQTTEAGTFYLPEKIRPGSYQLKELTEPKGYDASGTVEIAPERAYDWDEPYVAEVRVQPAKNILRVVNTDDETGLPVSGGSYEIAADGDIVTADGTIRYKDGEIVGTIYCGEDGTGESEELYLGRYILKEKAVPRYYAAEKKPVEAETEKKLSSGKPEAVMLYRTRTKAELTLHDELYEGIAIAGAEFMFYENGIEKGIVTTDSDGRILLSELDKNKTYRLQQMKSSGAYKTSEAEIIFPVDSVGRIAGKESAEYRLTNRMIRFAVNVRDMLLSGATGSSTIMLYSEDGSLAGRWNTSGASTVIEGLTPGTYELHVNGRKFKTVEITDTAELQTVDAAIWTMKSMAVLAGIGLAALLLIAAVVMQGLKRRKQKKFLKENEEKGGKD